MNSALRRGLALSATTMVAASIAVLVAPAAAGAHGAMMSPGSRTYLCWQDGVASNGAMNPSNPACAAAVAKNGPNALYNWFAVLRSDGAGRMAGYIPDGKLCSADAKVYDFSGFDLARDDWPVTHLTAGDTVTWKYSNWAAHPGTFSVYVTKDSWSPTKPLSWSDLEATPFLSVTNPPQMGSPGTADGHYHWTGALPSGKSGRHLIYSVWSRSDSQETFYGCSDVVFDGGKGEVTGIGRGSSGGPTPTATPSTTPGLPGGGSSSSASVPAGVTTCRASHSVSSSWQGGYQATVTVTNTGTTPLPGWMVHWNLGSGQDITQAWNGTLSTSGSAVTVTNVAWNGKLAPGSSTTFGYIGTGPTSAPSRMCMAG